jgi:hypothetical protein
VGSDVEVSARYLISPNHALRTRTIEISVRYLNALDGTKRAPEGRGLLKLAKDVCTSSWNIVVPCSCVTCRSGAAGAEEQQEADDVDR